MVQLRKISDLKLVIITLLLILISTISKAQSFRDKVANEAVVYYIQVEYDIELTSEQKDVLKEATLPLVVAYFEGKKIDRKTSKELKKVTKELKNIKKDYSVDDMIDGVLDKIEELVEDDSLF